MNGRILVLNCHEAWVYQLRLLGQPLDIVIGLPGRHTQGWDEAVRPVPANARLVSLPAVLAAQNTYDCIIAHNLTDLLDVKTLPGPRLFVIHLTLEGMLVEQNARTRADDFRRAVANYIERIAAHVVAISPLKGRSWGFPDEIVPLTAEPRDYTPWQGEIAAGLRVSNYILRRARTLHWDFHERAFTGLPVTLVGHNPELPPARASGNWAELKDILRRHRFFIHTAHPQLEDGYNMATLEAMAAGLPVLGNRHPTSPIVNGVNGFLSDSPEELNVFARELLADRELAAKMGRAAQQTVYANFSEAAFRSGIMRSMEKAQEKWRAARARTGR
jgi:Glycosyl transferases group 1